MKYLLAFQAPALYVVFTLTTQIVGAAGLGQGGAFLAPNPLVLNEIGGPCNIVSPPTVLNPTTVDPGVIYTQLAAHQRLDFIIEGINLDTPLNVYLSYSKVRGRPDLWVPFPPGQGQLELDPETLEMVTALAMTPLEISGPGLPPTPSTPLGTVERTHESIIIPVRLSDLSTLGVEGESIYFQAIAMPVGPEGEFLWDQAQASEVDEFIIDHTATFNPTISELCSTLAAKNCYQSSTNIEGPLEFAGTDTIQSADMISTHGSVTIGEQADITFESSGAIMLSSGFAVEKNAYFEALVYPVSCE